MANYCTVADLSQYLDLSGNDDGLLDVLIQRASADMDRLDRAYSPVIDAVARYDGSIVGFGRTDVLAVFPGDDGAARGRVVAGEIERHFSAQARTVSQRLQIGRAHV